MLLGEPNQTDFDVHFQCFGIPVRIHPGFWAISALLSLPAGREPLPVLGFALAIFLSILIHELGHALAFRKCGIQSHVVLYHFGGLAVPDSVGNYAGYGSDYSPRSKIFVTAMGPGVQMLSAVVISFCNTIWQSSDTLQFMVAIQIVRFSDTFHLRSDSFCHVFSQYVGKS